MDDDAMPRNALDLIRERTPMRTPNVLARTLLELIASGELPAGSRLPTVRDVAAALDMSTSSVALAWHTLAARRVIETRRRGGTVVLGPAQAPRAARFDRMMRASSGMPTDLGNLNADPNLYPDLEPAVLSSLANPRLNAWVPDPITPELRGAVEPHWPFQSDLFLATHGGVDAMELALMSTVGPGDRVIVESPTMARALDILESIGAIAIAIDYRDDGPDLGQLARALSSKPSAMLYQPAASTSGRSATPEWLDAAARLLEGTGIPVIEMVQAPFMHEVVRSLGPLLPDQVIHVHSFNFFYGADLRVAVAGGATEFIERMWLRLTYSSRWVSRLMQNTLAFQLTDGAALAQRDVMVAELHRRHRLFTDALLGVGFDVDHHAGPSIWLPVPDEHSVCTRMSRDGVLIHPGSMFLAESQRDQFVHINGTSLIEGHADMALALARACRARAN